MAWLGPAHRQAPAAGAELMPLHVDASLVAVAERLKLKSLVTTDRRDFRRVRPKHVAAFDLLP